MPIRVLKQRQIQVLALSFADKKGRPIPWFADEQDQGAAKEQDMSSSGLFQGFMSAVLSAQQKQPTTKDLLKQELMSQLLQPPTASIDPFQLLLNNNPYG